MISLCFILCKASFNVALCLSTTALDQGLYTDVFLTSFKFNSYLSQVYLYISESNEPDKFKFGSLISHSEPISTTLHHKW